MKFKVIKTMVQYLERVIYLYLIIVIKILNHIQKQEKFLKTINTKITLEYSVNKKILEYKKQKFIKLYSIVENNILLIN